MRMPRALLARRAGLVAGLFAFWFFADTTAWLLLAMPLVLVGAALAVVGRRPHVPATATA